MFSNQVKKSVWATLTVMLMLALATLACTPTVFVSCTPPPCDFDAGEVYYCPSACPGGCGTECATVTPTPTSAPTDTPLPLPPTATFTPTPTLAPTSTPSNTPTPLAPTDTPEPTNTPSPTLTPSPSPTPSPTLQPFASGGLGLSKAEWEQQHTQSGTFGSFVDYDNGKYALTFVDDKIEYLEQARDAAQTLTPEDSQFLETYSPEGFPELIVDLYVSESLKGRFDIESADYHFSVPRPQGG